MKEIKFRAWNNQAEKMIYSDEVYPRGMYKFEFDILSGFDFKLMKMVDRYNVTDDEGNDTYQEVFKAVEADIMQYIELKDVNGKEVYVGDILRDEEGFKWEVMHLNDGMFKISCDDLMAVESAYPRVVLCEVLGNIYESPELLE